MKNYGGAAQGGSAGFDLESKVCSMFLLTFFLIYRIVKTQS
jgi:hypothetical protein